MASDIVEMNFRLHNLKTTMIFLTNFVIVNSSWYRTLAWHASTIKTMKELVIPGRGITIKQSSKADEKTSGQNQSLTTNVALVQKNGRVGDFPKWNMGHKLTLNCWKWEWSGNQPNSISTCVASLWPSNWSSISHRPWTCFSKKDKNVEVEHTAVTKTQSVNLEEWFIIINLEILVFYQSTRDAHNFSL